VISGVGTNNDASRFLRQVVEKKELENKKCQIPENEKQINKTNEKRKGE
jgi:hypothetical protein